jgi:nicotinate phosphoribosyltransferase
MSEWISGLRTDLYELTMAQGYFLLCPDDRAVFNLFFRRPPFDGGYTVCAGVDTAAAAVTALRFEERDIAYLRTVGLFEDAFLEYLRGFQFTGDIEAVREGEIVFPGEPLLQVSGTLLETQILESLLLNIIGYQSLVATKTARIRRAARGGTILEFGLRRAQGPDGALSAARAAYIGGAAGTSNTEAGREYNIPAKGTMAHSWIMSFESELEAFRAYARLYPRSCILLIDTYDTLESGIGSAIRVGLELESRLEGDEGMFGVRLDSGDFLSLSREVRKRLDDAGLEDALIVVSGDQDEYSIHELVSAGAPIDAWGVGTRLVTSQDDPALTGVYKLAAVSRDGEMRDVMKISDDRVKSSLPGRKQILRGFDEEGRPVGDLICLADEVAEETGECTASGAEEMWKAVGHEWGRDGAGSVVPPEKYRCMLTTLVQRGRRTRDTESLTQVRERVGRELACLDECYTRIHDAESYPVKLSRKLDESRDRLSRKGP